MDDSTKGWGFIILIFLLFIVFGGSASFGNRGFGNGFGYGMTEAAISDAKVSEIRNTATTQYLIEQQGAAAIAATKECQNAIGAKIDYYGYMDLRDKVGELQAKNMQLENQLRMNAQFGAINQRLDMMNCQMLKRPPLYGPVVLPNGTLYPPVETAEAPTA